MIPHYRVLSRAIFVIALVVASCARPEIEGDGRGADPPSATSEAPAEARRVVSLIPAFTEIVFALGVEERLVGRTTWGDHPPAAIGIPDVGDGMRPALEVVLARDPDLVVLYDSETNRESRDGLTELGVATLALRHDTLEDLERNILRLGEVVGCPVGARELVDWIAAGLASASRATSGRSEVDVYYEAWGEPPITIGRGSFIDSLLTIAGARNVFGDLPASAPRVSLEAILERDPEWILVTVPRSGLAEDPGLTARHGWDRVPAVSAGRVATLDRDLLTRLGPRVVDAAWEIARRLHPDVTPPVREAWEPPCTG